MGTGDFFIPEDGPLQNPSYQVVSFDDNGVEHTEPAPVKTAVDDIPIHPDSIPAPLTPTQKIRNGLNQREREAPLLKQIEAQRIVIKTLQSDNGDLAARAKGVSRNKELEVKVVEHRENSRYLQTVAEARLKEIIDLRKQLSLANRLSNQGLADSRLNEIQHLQTTLTNCKTELSEASMKAAEWQKSYNRRLDAVKEVDRLTKIVSDQRDRLVVMDQNQLELREERDSWRHKYEKAKAKKYEYKTAMNKWYVDRQKVASERDDARGSRDRYREDLDLMVIQRDEVKNRLHEVRTDLCNQNTELRKQLDAAITPEAHNKCLHEWKSLAGQRLGHLTTAENARVKAETGLNISQDQRNLLIRQVDSLKKKLGEVTQNLGFARKGREDWRDDAIKLQDELDGRKVADNIPKTRRLSWLNPLQR